jgi:exodeoxyribonuclease VII large subunit
VGRGGGSLEDLWAFNEEPVVRAIAGSRIPTVSAVGHEIDVTLADLVADVRALTPTEAAERVVPSSSDVSALVNSIRDRIHRSLQLKFASYRQRLDALGSRLRDNQQRLAAVSGKLDSLSPLSVLGRGYSLTQDAKSGRLITAAKQLKPGQEICTRLGEGAVISTITGVEGL